MSECLSDLARAIERGELFSEQRALLDYTYPGEEKRRWIESHEVLRRQLQQTEIQRDGLLKQLKSLSSSVSNKDEEIRSLKATVRRLESQSKKNEASNHTPIESA